MQHAALLCLMLHVMQHVMQHVVQHVMQQKACYLEALGEASEAVYLVRRTLRRAEDQYGNTSSCPKCMHQFSSIIIMLCLHQNHI